MRYTYYTSETDTPATDAPARKAHITLTRHASYRAAVDAATAQALEQRRDAYHAMYIHRATRGGKLETIACAVSDGVKSKAVRLTPCACGHVSQYRTYNAA